MNVLVIENDAVLADLAVSLINGWGYKGEKCVCAKEALKLCGSKVFDLVLLEALLPDMEADEFISHLKKLCPRAGVVVMTARNTRELEKRIRGKGVLYYMVRPFEADNLRALLEHVSARHGGEIRYEAKRNGSNFVFTLPR
ncbi:MAG: response regulator [Deltaproteobacteria bacterium]|nr:response regulator [Deltaproteobacteria bacterium]